MDYFEYNVKDAYIKMRTKNGEIYSIDEILDFNSKYGEYIKITGVGNEFSPVDIYDDCAVIIFRINKEYFKDEILNIQKSVDLIELKDTFDIYPLDIIEKRSGEVARNFNISKIYLTGDYAKGIQTKNSEIDFIVDFKEFEGFDEFTFPSFLNSKFKYEVNVFDLNKIKFSNEEVVKLNI